MELLQVQTSSSAQWKGFCKTSHISVYLDDILISGANEHLRNLDEVLSRLEKSGLRMKRSKCEFMGEEVVFLGHKINVTGLQPVAEKYKL